MSIKLYNVTGLGFVIGEKISQENDYIYLEYPAIIAMQVSTPQGVKDVMVEPVPPIFIGRNEILKRFPLKKSLIIYSGKPTDKVSELYGEYTTQLQSRLSGIHLVNGNKNKIIIPK